MDPSLGLSWELLQGGGRYEENISSVHLAHHPLGNNLWELSVGLWVLPRQPERQLTVICTLCGLHRTTASIPALDLTCWFWHLHLPSVVFGVTISFIFLPCSVNWLATQHENRKAKRVKLFTFQLLKLKYQDYETVLHNMPNWPGSSLTNTGEQWQTMKGHLWKEVGREKSKTQAKHAGYFKPEETWFSKIFLEGVT